MIWRHVPLMEDHLFLTKILKALQSWNVLGSQTSIKPSYFWGFSSTSLPPSKLLVICHRKVCQLTKTKKQFLYKDFETDFLLVIVANTKLIFYLHFVILHDYFHLNATYRKFQLSKFYFLWLVILWMLGSSLDNSCLKYAKLIMK